MGYRVAWGFSNVSVGDTTQYLTKLSILSDKKLHEYWQVLDLQDFNQLYTHYYPYCKTKNKVCTSDFQNAMQVSIVASLGLLESWFSHLFMT